MIIRHNRLLGYNPETGELTRKVTTNSRAQAGFKAGTLNPNGYYRAMIDGRILMVHRVAWKMATGQEPPATLDHIDGNPGNNRLSNLRPASFSQNQHNRGNDPRNKSGHKGICWNKAKQKWRAEIKRNGVRAYHAEFEKLADAVNAITEARRKIHGQFANHG
jgi:hypothetical protein